MKGYQATEDVEFACTVKVCSGRSWWSDEDGRFLPQVKGIASTMGRRELPWAYRGIWDPSDYLLSTHHNEAFFITTNAIITNQQR